MSDLAPFVAAVLRDKSIADMKEDIDSQRRENDVLRQQLRDTRAVKITGVNGSPVFARAQLEDGILDDIGRDYQYLVRFPDQQQQHGDLLPVAVCSPRDLMNLEVHIGSLRIETFSGPFVKEYSDAADNDPFGYFTKYSNGSSVLEALSVTIGPFISQAEFDEFDPDGATTSQTNRNGASLQAFDFLAIFRLNAIRGMIDNFEQRRQDADAERARRRLEMLDAHDI
jgi:hypothetical protein